MVYFTCNKCGESVKKVAVEKHYHIRCRNPKNVSCMDCQKDFFGEEYVSHTNCVTEAEKYSGKNFVAKEKKNSGLKKQETWMDIVRSILESREYQLSAQTRDIFQRLQNYNNVPRKKNKFENFVENCLRIPARQAKPVWEVLEKEMEKMKKIKEQESSAIKALMEPSKEINEATAAENGIKRKQTDNVEEEKVKKKRKLQETKATTCDENGVADVTEKTEIFQWCKTIEKLVAKFPDGLPVEKLKKKLVKKYKKSLQLQELNEKQQKKFEKKFTRMVQKCSTVKIDAGIAKPC